MQQHTTYEQIYAVVQQIPAGKVSSYGRIARVAGLPGQARLVGYALHALRTGHPQADSIPWWRVINAQGYISNAYEATLQREHLEAEGVQFSPHGQVDLATYLWDGAGVAPDGA